MKRLPICCLSLLVAAELGAQDSKGPKGDPVILSFAVTGDSRIDPTRPKIDFDHYFNLVQVRQTLQDLAAIKDPAPKYLFLTGDLVMGFKRNDQGATLKAQLADFTKAIKDEPVFQTLKLVPLPGNHEMTFKEYNVNTKVTTTGDDDDDQKAWQNWMAENKHDSLGGNGPRNGLDNLEGDNKRTLKFDQSKMTYSFNSPVNSPDNPPDRFVHFVVINTDTATSELTEDGYETEGLMPLPWVKDDIERAQKDPAIKAIFVVGHKPVFAPANFQDPGEDDHLNEAVAKPFRKILNDNNKVKAYLVSHAHLFHVDTLAPTGAANARPVQIVAGNGGTAFEKFWANPFFGFTLLKVYASGKVTYNSWQREVPDPYYGPYKDPAKAQARPTADVEIK